MGNSATGTNTNRIADVINHAINRGGGLCVALHDGAAYAEIPDPTGRSEPIPVLLTVRVRSNAQAVYEECMARHGYVTDGLKAVLLASYAHEGLDIPPGLRDCR